MFGRRPLVLAIAASTRNPANTIATTSGRSAIVNTFHRTGQLRGDQDGGRC